MPVSKRPYRMRRRAKSQQETRQRIIEAAVELHGSLGPAQTSLKAVAERAGVQRATLYAHFPEERDLLLACSSHYFEVNPAPDPKTWQAEADPEARLRLALREVYLHHRRTEPMTANVLRDLSVKPELLETAEPMLELNAEMRRVLEEVWDSSKLTPRLQAAVGHALDFGTWRSLVRQEGLSDAEAVELMAGFVLGAALPFTTA